MKAVRKPGGVRWSPISNGGRSLDEVHATFRCASTSNVALGRAQGRMSCQHLHVSEVIIARCRLSRSKWNGMLRRCVSSRSERIRRAYAIL